MRIDSCRHHPIFCIPCHHNIHHYISTKINIVILIFVFSICDEDCDSLICVVSCDITYFIVYVTPLLINVTSSIILLINITPSIFLLPFFDECTTVSVHGVSHLFFPPELPLFDFLPLPFDAMQSVSTLPFFDEKRV